MSKIIHFIPQFYMILSMTLSITFIHYLLGHTSNFWFSWGYGFTIAAPLAMFFSIWIKPIMKKLTKQNNQFGK